MKTRSGTGWFSLFGLAATTWLLAGCAERLVMEPVSYTPFAQTEAPRVLRSQAEGRPMTGSIRPVPAGTRLQAVGRVPQGVVMRPIDREVTISGEDRHETFLVVERGTWVGAYLPFERTYLSLRNPIVLQLE